MIKRCLTTLLLAVLFSVILPLNAGADGIVEPNNDFYIRNKNMCVDLGRSFCANGEGGYVFLKTAPDAKEEGLRINNGLMLYIVYTYNENGELWGFSSRPAGWVPMEQLLLPYDHISFEEDYGEEFYRYNGSVDLYGDIVFWTWPGSGVIHQIYRNADWRDYQGTWNNKGIREIYAYKDNEGREWIRHWYADKTSVWVCLSDAYSVDIPPFNLAPEPGLWQPGDEHLRLRGGLPLPVLVIILVAALSIVTAVLIRVFWKKKN